MFLCNFAGKQTKNKHFYETVNPSHGQYKKMHENFENNENLRNSSDAANG